MIPLSTVARIEPTQGPSVITLYNLFPSATINGAANDAFSSGQALATMEGIANKILPAGMSYEWTAMSYQEKLVGSSTYFIFALAILLVYFVLAGQYESWITPAAVILAVPLALLGTVGALLALGVANNLYVQIGLVLLIALSAKNAILIVEMAREGRAAGKSIIDATVEASQVRFRPILMTSFTFILGVLPLVLASGAGASARKSLGLAVATGMLASTCLAVLFVPAFLRRACNAGLSANVLKQQYLLWQRLNSNRRIARRPVYGGMRKAFTLLTSAACLCAFLSFAPGASGQSPEAAAKLQSLSTALKLTPDQKVKLLPILEAEGPKLQAIKNNTSLSGFQKLRQLQAIHDESAPQLQKILSPAQYQQLQAIRQEDIKKAIAAKRAGGG